MTLSDWAQISNYAVAAGTVVIALAFLAHLAEWGFAPRTARERVVVGGERVALGEERVASAEERVAVGDKVDASTMLSSIGVSLTGLAALILTVGVVSRGIAAGRVPWSNMYEFAVTGTTIVLIVYLVLVRVQSVEWVATMVTGFGLVLLGIGFSVYVPAGPVVPALQSYWLIIHVAAVMIAGALFLVSASAAVLFLIKSRAESRGTIGHMLSRVPASAAMDRLSFRVTAVAFPLWTFGALIAGPIWAYNAWGRYWGWDPKEVWAFITWVIYACYLHARVTVGWKGKRAAIICLIGFATFMFSFYGVNLLFGGSQHTYAK